MEIETEKNVIDNNEKIAKYFDKLFTHYTPSEFPENSYWIHPHGSSINLQFDTNWQWLMCVIDEIEKESGCSFNITYFEKSQYEYTATCFYYVHTYSPKNKRFTVQANDKKYAAWRCICEYIDYANSLKNK